LESNVDCRDTDTPPADAAHLLAEFRQVFAEVMAVAEASAGLSAQHRQEAALAIEQAMESTRRMVERLATAEE
jgi:uncharacterized membrane protein YccC